ncbi:hypothetical protein LTR85_007896 [Meristemomyces frigidus]|nr:hypothetical protein LTR85_007896 [Meristemomyces frigidus]
MNKTIDVDSKYDFAKGTNSFGLCGVQWHSKVGNVLLVRKDRKPLELDVAEAFGAYCEYHVRNYFEWQTESEGYSKAEVMRIKEVVLAEEHETEEASDDGADDEEDEEDGVEDMIEGVARMGLTEKDSDSIWRRLFNVNNPF